MSRVRIMARLLMVRDRDRMRINTPASRNRRIIRKCNRWSDRLK